MSIDDVKEWIEIADNDFDSALQLNEVVRKHNEIICYHCSQAVEKYLKGYLVSIDIVPKKTHDLRFLNSLCIDSDIIFENLITECAYLNKFANDIRYPHKNDVNESDVIFSINAVKKVRNIKPINDLRDIYNNE